MDNQTKKLYHYKPLFAVILLIAMTVAMGFGTYHSVSAADYTLDPNKSADYSFYLISSTLAATLNTAVADPDEAGLVAGVFGNVGDPDKGINYNSAGGLLGYLDTSLSKAISGLTGVSISLSAMTYDYSQLSAGKIADFGGTGQHIFSPYCMLGAALADMGLDQVAADTGMPIIRSMLGGLMLVAYILAQSINVILKFVINILILINPFQFFYKVTGTGADFASLAVMDGNTNVSETWFGTVSAIISSIFMSIYNISDILFVVFFAMMIVYFVFFRYFSKTESRLGIFKKWFIRSFFIVTGVPFLGSMYTGMLVDMRDSFDGGNTAASKVIASTFVDFEGWVRNANMKMPDVEIKVDIDEGKIVSSVSNNVQDICYAINDVAYSGVLPDSLGTGTGGMVGNISKIQNETGSGYADDAEKNKEASTSTWIMDMLGRYMSGKKVFATDYETAWKSYNWTDRSDNKAIQKYISHFSSVDSVLANTDDTKLYMYGEKIQYTISGTAKNPVGKANTVTVVCDMNGTFSGQVVPKNLELSPIAVYNYLNSVFGETGIKVYSTEKATSMMIRDYHYSVNLVGKGVKSVVLYLLCFILLITYTILGFYYGFGIMMTNFKRGIRMIMAIPGAMLGSLPGIAKVVSYTVLMLIEVFASIMLYYVSTELLFTITTVVVEEFSDSATNILGGNFVIAEAFDIMTSVIAIIFLIWFTIQLIKMKKPIIKGFEEMADNVINKFITGNQGGSGSGSGSGEKEKVGINYGQNHSNGNETQSNSRLGRALNNVKREMNNTAAGQVALGQMFGQNGSAVNEERSLDQRLQDTKNSRKALRAIGKQMSANDKEIKADMEDAKAKKNMGTAAVFLGAATKNEELMEYGKNLQKEGKSDIANVKQARSEAKQRYNEAKQNIYSDLNTSSEKANALMQGKKVEVTGAPIANADIGKYQRQANFDAKAETGNMMKIDAKHGGEILNAAKGGAIAANEMVHVPKTTSAATNIANAGARAGIIAMAGQGAIAVAKDNAQHTVENVANAVQSIPENVKNIPGNVKNAVNNVKQNTANSFVSTSDVSGMIDSMNYDGNGNITMSRVVTANTNTTVRTGNEQVTHESSGASSHIQSDSGSSAVIHNNRNVESRVNVTETQSLGGTSTGTVVTGNSTGSQVINQDRNVESRVNVTETQSLGGTSTGTVVTGNSTGSQVINQDRNVESRVNVTETLSSGGTSTQTPNSGHHVVSGGTIEQQYTVRENVQNGLGNMMTYALSGQNVSSSQTVDNNINVRNNVNSNSGNIMAPVLNQLPQQQAEQVVNVSKRAVSLCDQLNSELNKVNLNNIDTTQVVNVTRQLGNEINNIQNALGSVKLQDEQAQQYANIMREYGSIVDNISNSMANNVKMSDAEARQYVNVVQSISNTLSGTSHINNHNYVNDTSNVNEIRPERSEFVNNRKNKKRK